ncbi:uncharacterized protein MEPE_04413 [Melanopsichium pennsylvanicum]|uniref:Uncharacterized protein n=1 Tax=Melanopsichium pennsylvanicum TaxID=63383 RepID=A0AAJ4XMQ6_9BASI|nr:uncharacterized protein MEPE_04413 [Melanopsichium pennsylvanicum]
MTSQSPSSATNAASSSQSSYLLAPLQSSTSSNVPITPSKARKQAQAERTRLMALSKHLMTRLQYANFKVEHGWSKQSLSEVENLYYRQNTSTISNPPPSTSITTSSINTASIVPKSNSTSPNNNNNNTGSKAAVTPSVDVSQPHSSSVSSRLFKEAAVKKLDLEGGDVFGGYGLATPPASAGSVPGATSYLSSKRDRSGSSTPISSPNTSVNSSVNKGAVDAVIGSVGVKRSPNSALLNRTSGGLRTAPAAAGGGAISYADFWNLVGSSTTSACSTSVSPNKKRNAEEIDTIHAIPSKMSSDNIIATISTPSTSPNKRVRMDLNSSTPSISHAKTLLADRGPSFASPRH